MWLTVLIPALFLGFFGHVTAIVSFMVTATSHLPDTEQGLATGLATLTQQIGITIGIPLLAATAATRTELLGGIHLALTANVLITVTAVAFIWTGLRPRPSTAEGSTSAGRSGVTSTDTRPGSESSGRSRRPAPTR